MLKSILPSGTTFFAILTLLCLGACRDTSAPAEQKKTKITLPLTTSQRIAQVTNIISRNNVLPSNILDAQIGREFDRDPRESGFAPIDFTTYVYLKVPPKDINKWNALIPTKMKYTPAPGTMQKYPWWINNKDISEFEFFESFPLFPHDGWVAVSRKTGEIWIFGFTT